MTALASDAKAVTINFNMPFPFISLGVYSGSPPASAEFLMRDPTEPIGEQYYRVPAAQVASIPSTALNDHINDINPHSLTAAQIGLGNVVNQLQLVATNNLSDLDNPGQAINNIGAVSVGVFQNHALNYSNPHGVTANQIGTYSQSQINTLLAQKADLLHVSDTNNPHAVTAAQVGNTVAQWNAQYIQDKLVNPANRADSTLLLYRSATDEYEFIPLGSAVGITAIADATDVSLLGPAQGDLLFYSSAFSAWTNDTPSNLGLALDADLTAHVNDVANPHSLTKFSIGLDQVVNGLQLLSANNLSDLSNTTLALSNLGIGNLGTQDSSAVNITGGTLSGVTLSLSAALTVGDGGTGADNAVDAAINLNVIPQTEKAQALGVASLDGDGLVPETQLPVIEQGLSISSVTNQTNLDVNQARVFTLNLTETTTIQNPSPPLNNGVHYLEVIQDTAGGHGLAFGGDYVLDASTSQVNADPDAVTLYRILKFDGEALMQVTNLSAASRKSGFTIGDGLATVITVSHNFNTRDVSVRVYENSGSYAELTDANRPVIGHTTVDSVTLTFVTAPSVDQYRVVIQG